mmetsp:Transcript_94490/g.148733  ORF Transcript_94490/g.148733 Transcript_94490/m.148733 type:complete len:461 (+) Transcript_94490:56-1438(+)
MDLPPFLVERYQLQLQEMDSESLTLMRKHMNEGFAFADVAAFMEVDERFVHWYAASMYTKLPVIVLTGYLGAGKTTLLNYILREQTEKKLAVIENEVGEVSIDDALVEKKHEDLAEELVTLDNGCVCCSIRGDLVKTLHDIAAKQHSGQLQLDGVLIELTGAADPAPVVQSFILDDMCKFAFFIDNVIALVDAKHAIAKLDESQSDRGEKGTACAQIAFSSTVLLNKIDLVGQDVLEGIEKRIKAINSVVNIIRCEQARVDMAKLFNVKAFDLASVLEEQYMEEEEFNKFYKPKMDRSISNVGIRCEGALDMQLLQDFISKYLDDETTQLDFLRVKGVMNIVAEDRMYVMQCVHMLRDENFTRAWREDELRENRIIFIGRGMQERRQELTDGFMACMAKPLRFDIGAKVMMRPNLRARFVPAVVVKHWDECRAYLVKLTEYDDELEWAPRDDDRFIIDCD